MSRASVLARGRAAAEAGMVDTCLIQRQNGSTMNSVGVVTPEYVTIYEGACKVQESGGLSRDSSPTPIAAVVMHYRTLHLPVATSDDVRAQDRVTITACVNDPDLVGVVHVVRDQAAKSFATARRVGIEQITG